VRGGVVTARRQVESIVEGRQAAHKERYDAKRLTAQLPGTLRVLIYIAYYIYDIYIKCIYNVCIYKRPSCRAPSGHVTRARGA
jgi:hypothetical protein